MSSKKHRQKKIGYKNNIFTGTLRGGKVSVRVQRTACGQNLLAGVFDVDTQTWQNENRSAPLPTPVKREIETAFT